VSKARKVAYNTSLIRSYVAFRSTFCVQYPTILLLMISECVSFRVTVTIFFGDYKSFENTLEVRNGCISKSVPANTHFS
jgi:hypothetical protein